MIHTANFTAYNKDIQRYMTYNDKSSTNKKNALLETLEEAVLNIGISFERLFPSKTKRKEVLDEILFMASGSGICKVSATTLANRVGCSVRTVSEAVKNLKETGEVLVGGLADGKNKYVFVLKSHSNFKDILKEVFYIENAELIATQIAEQDFSVTVGAVRLEGQKSCPNYNNYFNLKQESNNYIDNSFISKQDLENSSLRQAVENELKEVSTDPLKEAEYINTYYVSDYQREVYEFIVAESSDLHPSIKENASIVGLRVGSDTTDPRTVIKAIQAVLKVDMFLKRGGEVREGIPALFSKVYRHNLELRPTATTARVTPKVPFYNWLEIRD